MELNDSTAVPMTRVLAEITYEGSPPGQSGVQAFTRPAVVDAGLAPSATVEGRLRDALTRATELIAAVGAASAPSYGIEQVRDGVFELRPFTETLREQTPPAPLLLPQHAVRTASTAVALVGAASDGFAWADLRQGSGEIKQLPLVPGIGAVVRD